MGAKNEDQLLNYFEKSAHRVRQVFTRVEQNCITPSLRYGESAFRKHPTASTFLTIFALLSSLPVLSFIGFSTFIFTSTTFVALFLAFAVSTAITASITFLLVAVLLFLAIISAFLSATAIFAYLFVRLFVLVRVDGRAGLSGWFSETKSRFIRGEPQKEERGRSSSTVAVKNDPGPDRSQVSGRGDGKHDGDAFVDR